MSATSSIPRFFYLLLHRPETCAALRQGGSRSKTVSCTRGAQPRLKRANQEHSHRAGPHPPPDATCPLAESYATCTCLSVILSISTILMFCLCDTLPVYDEANESNLPRRAGSGSRCGYHKRWGRQCYCLTCRERPQTLLSYGRRVRRTWHNTLYVPHIDLYINVSSDDCTRMDIINRAACATVSPVFSISSVPR